MSSLLSKQSQARETEHIYESVSGRFLSLRKRMVRWASTAWALGFVSLGLIIGGAAMLALGQLPETVTLVQPAITSDQLANSDGLLRKEADHVIGIIVDMSSGILGKIVGFAMLIVGFMNGVLRNSLGPVIAAIAGSSMIFTMPQMFEAILGEAETYKPTPYAYIQPQLEAAKDAGDWAKAWGLLKPISDTSDDIIVLKAQVAYKAGLEPESVRLIQTIPDTDLSAHAWFIESAYADSHEGAGYQITNASQKYAENQTSRSSLGASMLKGSVPFGVLAFLTGCVAFVIRRNAISIQSWLKQSKTKAELNEIVANDKATMELVQTEECN